MIVEGLVHLQLDLRVGQRQEGQVERRVGRRLVGMVGGAEHRRLQAVYLHQVEQFLRPAEALEADGDAELSTRFLLDVFLDRLEPARDFARLAPGAEPPVDLRAIDGLRDCAALGACEGKGRERGNQT